VKAKLNVPAAPAGANATAYFREHADPRLLDTFMAFSTAVVRLPFADVDAIELIRLRNALDHACEY
jgi:hypothetical protein